MKKLLLLAALAFSMNVFAQFMPAISPIHSLNNQQQLRDLVQVYDSIYTFGWDPYVDMFSGLYERQIDFVYDANYNLISNLDQHTNFSGWINYARYTHTYDANNNQTSWLIEKWMAYSYWENDLLITFTYDANNNRTSQMRQDWIGSAWVNLDLYTFTYDVNNNQTSELRQNWNGSTWENMGLNTYTYDANNNWITYLSQSWDGNSWENIWLSNYSYDGSNNLIGNLYQTWNGSAWEDYIQETYTNNANGDPVSDLVLQWNGNAWINYWLFTYTYDANDNQATWLWQGWLNNAWVNGQDHRTYYDADNFLASESYRYFNPLGTDVTDGDSILYYFHTAAVGTNDLTALDGSIDIFPNPFSHQTTIHFNLQQAGNVSLEVFDVNGRKINTLLDQVQFPAGEHSVPFDAGQVASGIYCYRFTSNAATQSGKLVVH